MVAFSTLKASSRNGVAKASLKTMEQGMLVLEVGRASDAVGAGVELENDTTRGGVLSYCRLR